LTKGAIAASKPGKWRAKILRNRTSVTPCSGARVRKGGGPAGVGLWFAVIVRGNSVGRELSIASRVWYTGHMVVLKRMRREYSQQR